MAESLVLPVVSAVFGKATDALVQRVTRIWGVDDDRATLRRHLAYVQLLLSDAEVKAETNRAVMVWMKDLKAAAYEADDVLDGFHYEALRREALAGRSMASKVLSTFTSKNRLIFRHKASRDLRNVLEKIDRLVKEVPRFGLNVSAEAPPQVLLARQTHSALDESAEIFGRDDDKEVVVKLLLGQPDHNIVQVLPIIGMGGLGKTTLAKMVYNDHRVQKHFDLKLWHCVSDNFEATAVVKSVIQLAKNAISDNIELLRRKRQETTAFVESTNGTCDLPDNIELLRGKLQKIIGQKRFLLVLDDVWNEDQQQWEDDLKPLLCSSIGGSGSMIVVTTRSPQVALIMGTLPTHKLVSLSEDDSWELFSKKAFAKGVQEQPEFVTIGKRIVNKCKGLPLALKTMGGLMSSKLQVREWEAIATTGSGEKVLSTLKLSYTHLSSEMKVCFAFCAIFPKDYSMEKDKLIKLWMANGFIHEEGPANLAERGECIFNELVWRSFLQDVQEMKFYASHKKIECKMHDLMHDLAKDVTDECGCAQELSQNKEFKKDVRHMTLSNCEHPKIRGSLKETTALRTFLLDHGSPKDLKLRSIRALKCRHPSIRSQLHLRYLDLSGSYVTRLPNSVCTLFNLQSLWLNGCSSLRYLPDGITTLSKLSHIYLLGCDSLRRMPPKLSLMHNLRTLTRFVVGTEDGCGIEELKDMQQLGDRLELYHLRKVKSGSRVNLHEKRNVTELLLSWGSPGVILFNIRYDFSNNNEEEVLECLVPHDQLKILEVYGYGGLAVPQWMRDPNIFRILKELKISNCPRCKDLPIIWLSRSLEYLYLSNMQSLTTLCKNIDVEVTVSWPIFPKLKTMGLYDLPELDGWAENSAGEPYNRPVFPQLEKLNIRHCKKLGSLPGSPALKRCSFGDGDPDPMNMSMPLASWPTIVDLRIGCAANVVPPLKDQQSPRPLDTLRTLHLEGDDAFVSTFDPSNLQLGLRDCLAFVEDVNIWSCSKIISWPIDELRCFPRLRSLRFGGCINLEGTGSSSEEVLPLPQLEKLRLESCWSLKEIPKLPASLETMEISLCTSLALLPSNLGNLRGLHVVACDSLKALPDGLTSLERLRMLGCPGIEKFPQGLLQRLPALNSLTMRGCPQLQRRCCEGGEYIDFVSPIPNKDIPPYHESSIRKFAKKLLPDCN